MRQQELELLAREIVDDVLNNEDVEDSRFELKAQWPEPEKAAPRLAAHANASRGEYVIWIIGIDEKGRSLTDVAVTEKGDWLKGVERHFDGFAPRLLQDVNFKVGDKTLVALLFDSEKEAPFVVKASSGQAQFWVPWRVGTAMRAAKRQDLLSLLIPVRGLACLRREVEFNRAVASSAFGGVFRTREFFKSLETGLLDTVSPALKAKIVEAYVKIGNANERINGYQQFSGNWNARGFLEEEARRFFNETKELVVELDQLFRSYTSKGKADVEGNI